jgi:hypothetical protein
MVNAKMQVRHVCPCCNYNNSADNAYCSQCGTLLLTPKSGLETVAVNTLTTGNFTASRSVTDYLLASLGEHELALKFTTADEPVRIDRRRSIVLGREETSQDGSTLDLTPFGGVEAGVSRQHVVIDSTDNDLTITDLGSTNGTRLNGSRLTAHMPYILRSSDKVQLGTLTFYIYYKVSEIHNQNK